MTKKERKTVYQKTTERIVALLEAGTIPWRKPWKSLGVLPCNANSKRQYRGWNLFSTLISGYSSPYWATYEGWQKLGGQVKKGEKSTLVIGWKQTRYTKDETDDETGVTKKVNKRGLVGFSYNIFNEEQVEGATVPGRKTEDLVEHDPIEAAEALLELWHDEGGPTIVQTGDRACYMPLVDGINVPPMKQFESAEAFYRTTYHEMTHATGSENRLDRFKKDEGQFTFASESYSKEELVAELGASFLSAITGIDTEIEVENSAAYIQNWIKKLTDDPKLLISAASKAQKAADYIVNGLEEETEAVEAEAVAA